MVARRLVLLALPAHARHPDEVRVLLEQVHDVSVGELGRIAHALGRHGLDAGLVGLLGGLVGEHHREAQVGEEGVPEGIVLVHVERARDAHRTARGGAGVEHRAVEQQLVLEREQVGRGDLGLLVAGALLAAVARDEAVTVAKVVDREQAVVGAAAAVRLGLLHLQVVDLLAREQRGGAVLAGTVASEQRRAVAAHAAGDVGSDGVSAGELLEGAQRGVAHEGAALDHGVGADLLGVAHLDDLEQRVLDDGVREARGDVAHRGALLLRLLDTAVHEDRAAAAQVDRCLGRNGRLGELLDREAHRVGEALDERATARRARLVEHDVLDDAVAHAQALHVLAADVEDELHLGHERLGAPQVRDGLDLAGVGTQGLDEQGLAVAGRGDVADGALARQVVVDVVHNLARGAQDVAAVVAVPGVEELAVLAHHGGLHRGGAGVDADEHAAAVAREVALGDHLGVVARVELVELGLVGEEWVEAGHLAALHVAQVLERVDDLLERDALVRLAGERRARGHEQVCVLGDDAVLLVEVERHVEAVAQLGEVLERAAQEGDVATNGVTAGEARDRLVGHGLEDRGGHVGGRGALV